MNGPPLVMIFLEPQWRKRRHPERGRARDLYWIMKGPSGFALGMTSNLG